MDSDDDANSADDKKVESVVQKKSPAGISAVKVGVAEFFRNLGACEDIDSLEAYLADAQTKKFAVKVCAEFPDQWVSDIEDAGLRGLVEKAGKRLAAEGTVQTWLGKVEKAAKGHN